MILGVLVAISAIAGYIILGIKIAKWGIEKYQYNIRNGINISSIAVVTLSWCFYFFLELSGRILDQSNLFVAGVVSIIALIIVLIRSIRKTSIVFGIGSTLYLASLAVIVTLVAILSLFFIAAREYSSKRDDGVFLGSGL